MGYSVVIFTALQVPLLVVGECRASTEVTVNKIFLPFSSFCTGKLILRSGWPPRILFRLMEVRYHYLKSCGSDCTVLHFRKFLSALIAQ